MKASAGNVLMFVENSYPQDSRVKNEADMLTAAGWSVTVIALRKAGQSRSESIEGVQVYRLPRLQLFGKTPQGELSWLSRVRLKVEAVLGYVSEYVYFTTGCFVTSLYVWAKHGIDVIHAHNPPDTLFAVALPYKLLGKKYVFDHHDLCPELYRSRFGAGRDVMTRVLELVEWCNLRLADVTIATNQSYKDLHVSRGGRRPETVFVVRNGPNERMMKPTAPSARLRAMGKTILCYIGALNPQDGVDYLLRSLCHLRHDLRRDDFHCVIIGSGDSLPSLRALATELGLDDCVELTGFVSDSDLRAYLSAADICVDPDPSSPLNDVSTWIKVMEYMAFAKPIVSFDLKETRVSAQQAALFVPCNDEMAFARATAQLMDDGELRARMGRFGRERVVRDLQWSVVGRQLVAAYESLRQAGARTAEFAARRASALQPVPLEPVAKTENH